MEEISPLDRLSCGEIVHVANFHLETCLHMVNMKTNLSCGEMWRQIYHVEKFVHMRNLKTNLFCHNLCYFVPKSYFLPFTLFCLEKNFTKNCVGGEKRTNMRYALNSAMYVVFNSVSIDIHALFLLKWRQDCDNVCHNVTFLNLIDLPECIFHINLVVVGQICVQFE